MCCFFFSFCRPFQHHFLGGLTLTWLAHLHLVSEHIESFGQVLRRRPDPLDGLFGWWCHQPLTPCDGRYQQLVGRRVHILEHPVEVFLVRRTGLPLVYRRSTLEIPRDDKVLLHLLHHVIDRDEFAALVYELDTTVFFYRRCSSGTFCLRDTLELTFKTGLLEVLLTANSNRFRYTRSLQFCIREPNVVLLGVGKELVYRFGVLDRVISSELTLPTHHLPSRRGDILLHWGPFGIWLVGPGPVGITDTFTLSPGSSGIRSASATL